ncbi:ATP-binding cassette domain-containing protein [Aurantivibrio plasticivorans]
MIQLHNISILRGSKQLLADTSLTIHPGEKVGLVGANGCGKSSLFQLLLGKIQVDQGECSIPKGWRLGHMQQEIHNGQLSALDFVLDGDKELRAIQQAIADCDNNKEQTNAEHLASLYGELERLDGYRADAKAATLLAGLGFSNDEMKKPVTSFSGGWRVRLSLAQALMCPSDLLLLDEPTNHLDLGATLWLENWLRLYPGTLFIVSHDRDFLDNLVNVTVHIEQQQLNRYSGNYSNFEKQRAAKLAQQQQLFEKQQERIKEIQAFVNRFKAKASKAKQAQSRLKELSRIDEVAPAHIDSPFNFTIPCAEKIPKTLISLEDAIIGYPTGHQVNNVNFSLYDFSRIGLLGPNGAGKSTLLRTLANDLPLLSGKRIVGDQLNIGYFAQHQVDSLDMDASAFLHIQRLSPKATEQSIRNFLGGFDFVGDRAFETVEHFSGGEKARLTLALIAWQKPNLLILDEPTNHLDMEMRHALTIALQAYEGAIIVVSHDRHLLRNTVDELVLVANGDISEYKEDLTTYEKWLSEQDSSKESAKENTKQSAGSEPSANKKQARQQAAERRAQLKPLTNKLKQLERQMDQLNKTLVDIEEQLANPECYEDANKGQLQTLLHTQAEARRQLDGAEADWLATQETLEELESDL